MQLFSMKRSDQVLVTIVASLSFVGATPSGFDGDAATSAGVRAGLVATREPPAGFRAAPAAHSARRRTSPFPSPPRARGLPRHWLPDSVVVRSSRVRVGRHRLALAAPRSRGLQGKRARARRVPLRRDPQPDLGHGIGPLSCAIQSRNLIQRWSGSRRSLRRGAPQSVRSALHLAQPHPGWPRHARGRYPLPLDRRPGLPGSVAHDERHALRDFSPRPALGAGGWLPALVLSPVEDVYL